MEVLAKFPETACLRARPNNPVLKQPLLSRDREGAVPFARFSRILQVPLWSVSMKVSGELPSESRVADWSTPLTPPREQPSNFPWSVSTKVAADGGRFG
jgi:hypothetical protein